jgi:hypothetical protein
MQSTVCTPEPQRASTTKASLDRQIANIRSDEAKARSEEAARRANAEARAKAEAKARDEKWIDALEQRLREVVEREPLTPLDTGEVATLADLQDGMHRQPRTLAGRCRAWLRPQKFRIDYGLEKDEHAIRCVTALWKRYEYVEERERGDAPRSWFVILDNATIAPLGLNDAARRAYAEAYRLRLGMSAVEMLVEVNPGYATRFAAWSVEPVTQARVKAWCENQNPPAPAPPRFEACDSWERAGDVVHLLAPVAAPTVATLAAEQLSAESKSERVFKTGLAPFDALFREGGVPEGSLVTTQGETGMLKTTFYVDLFVRLHAAGLQVAWLACGDEHAGRIRRRLAQRGAPQSLCLAVVDRDERVTLAGMLGVRPDVLFVDSLQTCGGTSLQAVEETIKAIRDSGVTVFATSELNRDVYRGPKRRSAIAGGKGSGAIEYRATMLLSVQWDGKASFRVEVLKNRDGQGARDGSVAFDLVPDLERQTFTVPGDSPIEAGGKGTDPIRLRIREALGRSGRRQTRRWLRDNVTGKTAAIRAAVDAMVGAGELVETEDGVWFP